MICYQIKKFGYHFIRMESAKKSPITPAERKRKSRENLKRKLTEDEFTALQEKEKKRVSESMKKMRKDRAECMTPNEKNTHKKAESAE